MTDPVTQSLRRLMSLAPPEEAPEQRPPTGFFTDATLCIGCKACEVACKQWNQLPADGFLFSGKSYDNTQALSATTWRHVAFAEQLGDGAGQPGGGAGQAPDRWLMLSDVCKHCEQAPCQQSCPTGALIHNEFGNVYVQEDICNGCGYCVAACPFGVLERGALDGRAHKCTLCYDRQRGDLQPACAKACPTGSIRFGPLDELRAHARRRVERLHECGQPGAYLYGDRETPGYSSLAAFFLLTDHPGAYNLPESPRRPNDGVAGRWAAALATGAALVGVAALWLRAASKERIWG